MHTKMPYPALVVCTLLIIPTTVFADNTVQLGVPFQLGFNQTATMQDLQIKTTNITDSRCPSDVTCVWQGQAKILVNVVKNGQDSGNFTLTTLNDKKQTVPSFDQYYIELMKVDPYPISGKKIQLSDYVITLKLSLFSPLKQFRSGISQVTCMQDLVLLTKLDNSPACVKPQTATKLVQRGWAHSGTTPSLEDGHGQNRIVTHGTNSEMANPASTYCINHGGSLEIRTDDAGQHGICVFHNGSECEEWQYFRGECHE